jgi:hypothetical protein
MSLIFNSFATEQTHVASSNGVPQIRPGRECHSFQNDLARLTIGRQLPARSSQRGR